VPEEVEVVRRAKDAISAPDPDPLLTPNPITPDISAHHSAIYYPDPVTSLQIHRGLQHLSVQQRDRLPLSNLSKIIALEVFS